MASGLRWVVKWLATTQVSDNPCCFLVAGAPAITTKAIKLGFRLATGFVVFPAARRDGYIIVNINRKQHHLAALAYRYSQAKFFG